MSRWGRRILMIAFLFTGSSLRADELLTMPAEPKGSERVSPGRKTPPDISHIPFDKITGPHRDRIIEILRKPVSWTHGRDEMFPCDRPLLEWLVDHPDVAGEYWKQIGISITDVERLSDGGYICRDPSGTTVHFYQACDEPDLRVCYCIGESPAGVLPVKMRAELVIVHRFRFQEFQGAGTYVVQRLDGFATATGPALKLAMKLAPGQAEKMVETCVHEMKVFFCVMCRLIQVRPHWSLEKFPTVTEKIPESERVELEGILKALPPTRRPMVIVPPKPQQATVPTLAQEPAEDSTR